MTVQFLCAFFFFCTNKLHPTNKNRKFTILFEMNAIYKECRCVLIVHGKWLVILNAFNFTFFFVCVFLCKQPPNYQSAIYWMIFAQSKTEEKDRPQQISILVICTCAFLHCFGTLERIYQRHLAASQFIQTYKLLNKYKTIDNTQK